MRRLKALVPNWAIPLAINLRCLWRRWRLGRKIPFRTISTRPALVIAPHPDDETFGCGAFISLKRQAGIPVRVLLLTNGEAVESGVEDNPETVSRVRQAQAVAACKQLGVEAAEVRCLNLPDGKLPRRSHAGFDEALQRLLAELNSQPHGELLCPHPSDRHPDHEAAAELAFSAVRLSGRPWRLIYYPVWLWFGSSVGLGARLALEGAWRLDGRAVEPKKSAAISEYLKAPLAASGDPFCGRLPWAFLWNFQHASEVFFEEQWRHGSRSSLS